MTIEEWLATRTPAPPPELMHRLREALGTALDRDARSVHEEALAAAERLLIPLVARGCRMRDEANVLLTADALVTYAFEAAADEPDSVIPRATKAMERIANVVSRSEPKAPDHGASR